MGGGEAGRDEGHMGKVEIPRNHLGCRPVMHHVLEYTFPGSIERQLGRQPIHNLRREGVRPCAKAEQTMAPLRSVPQLSHRVVLRRPHPGLDLRGWKLADQDAYHPASRARVATMCYLVAMRRVSGRGSTSAS